MMQDFCCKTVYKVDIVVVVEIFAVVVVVVVDNFVVVVVVDNFVVVVEEFVVENFGCVASVTV